MQYADTDLGRSSLMTSLRRYSAAVRDMEETVLLPSLLREVAAAGDTDNDDDGSWEQEGSGKDLYEHYHMLKALRNTAESGLVASDDDHKDLSHNHRSISTSLESLLKSDPEVLLNFHLHGIFSIMNNLANKSQSITSKYLEIIRNAN